MKKIIYFLITVIFLSGILFFGISCKTESETITETVVETVIETVIETAEAEVDKDAVDLWIKAMHDRVEPYKGEINFEGPEGQTPVWGTELVLTNGEVETIKQGNYKIIIPWWAQEGEYVLSLGKGIEDAATYLGMEIVAETDAVFDPAKQQSDVETMMALDPDIVIMLPLDNVIAANTLRPVVDAGKTVVLISNQPEGFVAGQDYAGITTSMPYDAARKSVKSIADIKGEDAKVGLVTFSANFWITNFQDQVVRDTIANEYPEMEIVEEQSFADPNDTTAIVASIIQRHPDVDAFYVTFNTASVGAIAGAQEVERPDVGIATIGVSLPLLVDMINGGNMIGLINDTTYNIGINCVVLAAYGILGKTAPEYTISPNAVFTQNQSTQEIIDTWKATYNIPLPEEITTVLAQ